MINDIFKVFAFLGIQYTLGRRGSFPYGILVNYSLLKISILVLISDIIQTILLLNFFEIFINKLNLIEKIKKIFRTKFKTPNKNKLEKFKKFRGWGILLVSILPYGGGALSGSILAVSLRFEKLRAFIIIIFGCTIGTSMYYLGFLGILHTVN